MTDLATAPPATTPASTGGRPGSAWLKWLARRLGLAVLTLWLCSVLVFFATAALGDPVRAILGKDYASSPERVAALEASLKLDQPVIVRYFDWLGGLFTGNLGSEVPGFIANRLQEALWREALHMVANGEATVEQIDASITEGPGLRWAFQGPMLTFHLAGGPGGMGHMLDHFGPSLLSPWTRLAAPELTPELRDSVVRGCEEEAGSRTVADLVRERDRWLVDVLRLLGKEPYG